MRPRGALAEEALELAQQILDLARGDVGAALAEDAQDGFARLVARATARRGAGRRGRRRSLGEARARGAGMRGESGAARRAGRPRRRRDRACQSPSARLRARPSPLAPCAPSASKATATGRERFEAIVVEGHHVAGRDGWPRRRRRDRSGPWSQARARRCGPRRLRGRPPRRRAGRRTTAARGPPSVGASRPT